MDKWKCIKLKSKYCNGRIVTKGEIAKETEIRNINANILSMLDFFKYMLILGVVMRIFKNKK